jgi:hypothetical protein
LAERIDRADIPRNQRPADRFSRATDNLEFDRIRPDATIISNLYVLNTATVFGLNNSLD